MPGADHTLRRCAVGLALLFGAGCSSGERYLVEPGLLARVEHRPPATWSDQEARRVGELLIDVRCVSPAVGDAVARYEGEVDAPTGRWHFDEQGPIAGATDLPCEAPPALDQIAERAAKRYREAHAVVAAERASDGEPVYLRYRAIRSRSAPAGDGRLTVEARAFNGTALVGAILLGTGALNFGVGAALYGYGSSQTSCGDFGCLGGTLYQSEGVIEMILGGVLIAAGAIVGLVSLGRRPQEVDADRTDVRYFDPATRRRAPRPPPAIVAPPTEPEIEPAPIAPSPTGSAPIEPAPIAPSPTGSAPVGPAPADAPGAPPTD